MPPDETQDHSSATELDAAVKAVEGGDHPLSRAADLLLSGSPVTASQTVEPPPSVDPKINEEISLAEKSADVQEPLMPPETIATPEVAPAPVPDGTYEIPPAAVPEPEPVAAPDTTFEPPTQI